MKLKTNLALRISDYFVAVLIGSLSAVAIHFVVSPAWSMPTAMFAGMALAMVVMTMLILPFSLMGGIFEIIMPGMFIANITGMTSGMWIVISDPPLSDLWAFGFLTGLLIQGLFHLYDRSLHGETTPVKQDS